MIYVIHEEKHFGSDNVDLFVRVVELFLCGKVRECGAAAKNDEPTKGNRIMRELSDVELDAVSGGDQPAGFLPPNPGGGGTTNGSAIGQLSSDVIQNGQEVGGNKFSSGVDQTTGPGTRSAIVQQVLGHS